MYLHYELHLSFDKIVRATQAACKQFDRATNRYKSKVLLYNPFARQNHDRSSPARSSILDTGGLSPRAHMLCARFLVARAQLDDRSRPNPRAL